MRGSKKRVLAFLRQLTPKERMEQLLAVRKSISGKWARLSSGKFRGRGVPDCPLCSVRIKSTVVSLGCDCVLEEYNGAFECGPTFEAWAAALAVVVNKVGSINPAKIYNVPYVVEAAKKMQDHLRRLEEAVVWAIDELRKEEGK